MKDIRKIKIQALMYEMIKKIKSNNNTFDHHADHLCGACFSLPNKFIVRKKYTEGHSLMT